jgi:hypothetical protein
MIAFCQRNRIDKWILRLEPEVFGRRAGRRESIKHDGGITPTPSAKTPFAYLRFATIIPFYLLLSSAYLDCKCAQVTSTVVCRTEVRWIQGMMPPKPDKSVTTYHDQRGRRN